MPLLFPQSSESLEECHTSTSRLCHNTKTVNTSTQSTQVMPTCKLLLLLCMSMQAALAKEKSERARIVLSLRDTITGLKQAGDVEGRLKADLVQTHEHLAASRAAQVSPHAMPCYGSRAACCALCHAMALGSPV
jgi:hypothetical protein